MPLAPQFERSSRGTHAPPHTSPLSHAHSPDTQRAPTAHALPHAPQFAASQVVSMQAPSHHVWPETGQVHSPSLQTSSLRHRFSQAPQ